MKLSAKLIIGTQCLLAAAFLTFGVLVVRDAREKVTQEAVSYVLSEGENLNSVIQEVQKKFPFGTDRQLSKTALNYSIKTKRHPQNIQYALMSETEVIYNETGVNVARIMQNEKVYTVRSSDYETVNWTIVRQGEKDWCIAARKRMWTDEDAYWQAAVFDVTQNLNRVHMLMRNSLLIGIAVMAAVFLLEFIFIRRVLAPLEELKESAAQIAGGNYEKRISVTNQSDELGALAIQFNEMAEAVQHQMSELCEERDQQKLLLRAMAHEMRTPITAINGYAFALQSTRLTADQQHEALLCLQEQSKRLAGLSDSLNTLIRAPLSAQLVEISSAQLKHQLEQTLYPVAQQKHIELSFNWSNQPLQADGQLMQSLLCNLFDNAAKAGALYITIGYDGTSLWVTDDGCGMESEEIKNVTRPFYQVDRSRKKEGFGLGLALCECIAQIHGGTLNIESTLGKGTTITLRLP